MLIKTRLLFWCMRCSCPSSAWVTRCFGLNSWSNANSSILLHINAFWWNRVGYFHNIILLLPHILHLLPLCAMLFSLCLRFYDWWQSFVRVILTSSATTSDFTSFLSHLVTLVKRACSIHLELSWVYWITLLRLIKYHMSGIIDVNIIQRTLFFIKSDGLTSCITTLFNDVTVANTVILTWACLSLVIGSIVLFSLTNRGWTFAFAGSDANVSSSPNFWHEKGDRG